MFGSTAKDKLFLKAARDLHQASLQLQSVLCAGIRWNQNPNLCSCTPSACLVTDRDFVDGKALDSRCKIWIPDALELFLSLGSCEDWGHQFLWGYFSPKPGCFFHDVQACSKWWSNIILPYQHKTRNTVMFLVMTISPSWKSVFWTETGSPYAQT